MVLLPSILHNLALSKRPKSEKPIFPLKNDVRLEGLNVLDSEKFQKNRGFTTIWGGRLLLGLDGHHPKSVPFYRGEWILIIARFGLMLNILNIVLG